MEELNVGEKFVISDEQEGDLEVEVVARANVEGTDYIAVCFVEDLDSETDEDIDVFFLKLDEKGDPVPLETDTEFDKVSSYFDEILEDAD